MRRPAKPPKSAWEEMRDHPLAWALGLIAALIAVGAPIHDALQKPAIHVHAGAVADPFELAFSLHNPSWLFPMKDTQFVCVDKKVILAGNNQFLNNNFEQSNLSVDIGPGRTIEYTCPFNHMIGHAGMPTLLAQIAIDTTFKTLGITRKTQSELFTWTAQSQQWIEGDVVN